jgi:hypothetical protein
MAYKIFRQGEPPSQRDLQMLMDQGVIVATSTTRPFAPHEGMLIYQSDTNGYMWYNGTTWVALGSAIDAWVSGSNLSVPGNLSAGGTLGVTGAATVASLASSGSVTMQGSIVSRVVDGKVGSGSTDTTTALTGTTNENIISGNIQNTPVISGRFYRVSGQISLLSSVANIRGSLKLWNGSVDGTRLGGDSNFRSPATNFQSYSFAFAFAAVSTETIANINMSIAKIDGATSGSVTARIDGNFFTIVEELGLASAISGA